MLDPCPVGIPHDPFRHLLPEFVYGFEQSCLYPTKRALMLVSRTWAELAVEFMYESLVIERLGVGRPHQVFATLEGSNGPVLKKWVKRVDIFGCPSPPERNYVCERLARIGLPDLRVQYMFDHRRIGTVPVGKLLPKQPLHFFQGCGSPILGRLTSRGGVFGSLRCLTLCCLQSLMTKPLPPPFHLPSNLRRLTIIGYETDYLRVRSFFSIRDSFALPNLTHLILHHRCQARDRFVWSMEIINHIGPQLRHLTITASNCARDWTGADLCTILFVCTQLTELVIPYPLRAWKSDPGDYGHSILQTLGIPFLSTTSERDFKPYFDIFSRREAFPKLGTIRLVEDKAPSWLEPYAQHLRGHGIRLEDCWGHPLLPAPVLDDQN